MTTEPIPPPQNLKDWTTKRLERLLDDYRANLPHVRSLYGAHHPETVTYLDWIAAIQEELTRRHDARQTL